MARAAVEVASSSPTVLLRPWRFSTRVTHRYTAVYRLVAVDIMVNVTLADKRRQPRPDFLAQVPVGSSFCRYFLRDGSFQTANSSVDVRLAGHPCQGVMRSYCGIPVFDSAG